MTFAFRISFILPLGQGLMGDATELLVHGAEEKPPWISLEVADHSLVLQESRRLALFGRGYDNYYDAKDASAQWLSRLTLSLVALSVGADLSDRSLTSGETFNRRHFAPIAREQGVQLEGDIVGVSIYEESGLPVRFLGGSARATVLFDAQRLIALLSGETAQDLVTARERLAYAFYSLSTFLDQSDARFALLMAALECLIVQGQRDEVGQAHVRALIVSTQNNMALDEDDRSSIVRSLQNLYSQSIGQAGRELASHLGDQRFMQENESAVTFFDTCYTMRSNLLHGNIDEMPTPEAVSERVGELQRFVQLLIVAR